MNEGTQGTSAAPAAAPVAGEGLSSDWDSILADDFAPTADDGDETPQGDAGAPPAATGEAPKGSEGESNVEHAGAPPADAADAAPDDGTASGTEFAPFTYTVNGETRAAEGFFRTPDGVVVDNDRAEWLMQRLSERDHYFEKDQRSYAENQRLTDQLTKLTTWQVKDARGQLQTLTGADAVETQRVQLGRALAENAALHAALRDPRQLAQLVSAQQAADGTWYIVPNEDGLSTLAIRLDRDGMRVEQLARQQMQGIRSSLNGATSPANTQASFVPNEQQIAQTVKNAAQTLGVTNLTAEDEQFLAKQLPRYIRDATTPAERAQFGAKVLDGDFRALVQDRSNQRAALAKTATTATQVSQQNAAAIRAANVGKRPAGSPNASTSSTSSPPKPTAQDDAWDRRERAARAAFTRRAG